MSFRTGARPKQATIGASEFSPHETFEIFVSVAWRRSRSAALSARCERQTRRCTDVTDPETGTGGVSLLVPMCCTLPISAPWGSRNAAREYRARVRIFLGVAGKGPKAAVNPKVWAHRSS